MASVAGPGATRSEHPPLERAVLDEFYRRMRAVAPAAVGAIGRDRADDPGRPFADTACGRLVRSLDEGGLRALGMWAHHWCMRFYDGDTRVGLRLVREIARRSALGWTADEVRWMLRESHAAGPAAAGRFTLPLAAAAEVGPDVIPRDELATDPRAPAGWPPAGPVVPRQLRRA
ncbi:hypothetical protein ACFOOK_09790 [Micromonospora krabiensis]|uniref:hypothetical protein n=1 Tax=Micromonospora krabiensis TaxID=307121 RepID=UPI001E2E354B|nr:hypothetical protein [Micromonospora krabiensis]